MDIKALTIHGRTTKEQSKVPNHWEEIGKIRQMRDEINPEIAIIGNGDVVSREQGEGLASHYKLDGIMIGRGVFHDPFVFSTMSRWHTMPKNEKLTLYEKHIKLFIEFWGGKKNPASLKKFAKVYINGFEGASDARALIMDCTSAEGMLDQLHLL
jgi:tRNA-dihydrouridine synthase